MFLSPVPGRALGVAQSVFEDLAVGDERIKKAHRQKFVEACMSRWVQAQTQAHVHVHAYKHMGVVLYSLMGVVLHSVVPNI
jgi:hypothetical protein